MKALSLFSGGLDSQLAAKVVASQGIEVILVNFSTPFFGTTDAMQLAADKLGLHLLTIDISDDYMPVLKNPRYGYGKNMNPCVDCHAFMIKQAGDHLTELDASFLITGEVLGQRPMSQNKSALEAVAKHSGYRGLILRPLSAQLLAPTTPELEGWVDREKLLAISGRSREIQMKLADELGISEYPSPAGGCLLTQESFSNRLRKVLDVNPEAPAADMHLLRWGRHFWLDGLLLVVGRKAEENEAIEQFAAADDLLLKVTTHPGPTALIRTFGTPLSAASLEFAASICARYSDARNEVKSASVNIWHPGQSGELIEVVPCNPGNIPMTY